MPDTNILLLVGIRMISNYNILTLPNINLLLLDVPVSLFSNIKIETTDIEQSFLTSDQHSAFLHKTGLTSTGIPTHFKLKKNLEEWKQFLPQAVDLYYTTSPFLKNLNIAVDNNIKLFYQDPWVNIQKNTDFFPNHKHEGLLSYVLWIRVPQETTVNEFAGKFEITYSDILGNSRPSDYKIDQSFEGKLLVFPAMLRHCVYPFYNSSTNRISLSGNILLEFHS